MMSTIWSAALIATLACVAAWPVARTLARLGFQDDPKRRRRSQAAAALALGLALAPAAMPDFLAYAGFGLLRDPSLPTGRAILELASDGRGWLPGAVGRAVAVAALALHHAPLAALILAAGVRTIERGAHDARRLEPGAARGSRLDLAMLRGWIAIAFAAVLVRSVGSAVPMHLAQIETSAIRVWRALDEGRSGGWSAWLAAWPLLAIAAAAGVAAAAAAAALLRDDPSKSTAQVQRPRAASYDIAAAACVVVVAIGVPGWLFANALGDWSAIARVARVEGRALTGSLEVAAVVACALAAVSLAVAWAAGLRARAYRVAVLTMAGASTALGVVPGVLLGDAAARFGTHAAEHGLAAVRDGPWLTAAVHATRFAWVAAAIGLAAAVAEGRAARDQFAIDAGRSPIAWWRAHPIERVRTAVAAAMLGGWLSIHEIEASVQIRPPGLDSLAHTLLGYLHYNRIEPMVAGGLLLLGASVVVALAAGLLAFIGTPGGWSAPRRR